MTDGCNIKLSGLNRISPEAQASVDALIEEAKVRKQELVRALRSREVIPSPDLQEVIVEATDMTTLHRWKAAIDAGRVVLEGKVQYRPRSCTVTIRYRYAAGG